MDSFYLLLVFIISALSVLAGYILGISHASYIQGSQKPVGTPAIASLSQELEEKIRPHKRTRKRRAIELGAVNRPEVEELEKKEKPVLAQEDEAWDEVMGELGKESIESIVAHPNNRS